MEENEHSPRLLDQKTKKLKDWAAEIKASDRSEFEKARLLARRLGAHYADSITTIGFWTPDLTNSDEIFLEIYQPLEDVRFKVDEQQINFYYKRIPIKKQGDYCWGVYEGLAAGDRENFGCFYRLWYRDEEGNANFISDPLACSLPFGGFAPAELYDLEKVNRNRNDKKYFALLHEQTPEEVPRIEAATNMLEVHVGTASARGTFKGLTDIYRQIAEKIRTGKPLSPKEQVYAGYDSIQLMPIEPVIENPDEKPFWKVVNRVNETSSDLSILVRHPHIINWGYDILIFGTAAVNATLLETGRPDEFVDFLEVMHNFPGKPIKVIVDIVFGHSDNQGKKLLNNHFFNGANRYGQNINYRHPVVRALLLEMQRRKMSWGIDAIRVDGAQDITYYDENRDEVIHDDEFLTSMSYVEQGIAGYKYYPWIIFEDGRPWPQNDWELTSTCRHLIEQQDFAYQWGPLVFSHNTPFLYTYWITKWWRVLETARMGERWISGYANHDTLRRGMQTSPHDNRINNKLGKNSKEIIDNAYDNPAATLLYYGFLPGVPMDFLNASFHSPWSFVRNTDTYEALTIISEEYHFLHWQITDIIFEDVRNFRQIKKLGFKNMAGLKSFLKIMVNYIEATDYDIPVVAELLNKSSGKSPDMIFTEFNLAEFAQAWMQDIYALCNVSRYEFILDHNLTTFNLKSRQLRHNHPWLQQNLGEDDYFDYLKPVNGSVVYYGLRNSPAGDEQLLFVANMEGEPVEITPVELPIPNLPKERWKKVLAAPKTPMQSPLKAFTLEQSKAVLFSRTVR